MSFHQTRNFDVLLGKTITSARVEPFADQDVSLVLEMADGSVYRQFYESDCCASCTLDGFSGDVSDLIGSPLVMAEEVTESSDTEYGSQTWSFYKLATVRGYVTLAWLGESNGYYSETVTLIEERAAGDA